MAAALSTPPSKERQSDTEPETRINTHENNNWDRTRLAEERLPSIALDNGMFQGHPVIHRDSRIENGVCLGSHAREAIVVDWKLTQRPSLQSLYHEALGRAFEDGRFHKENVLRAVYDTVKEHYNRCSKEDLKSHNGAIYAGGDKLVPLHYYLHARIGVCRHMALTCAAILERMVDQKILGGSVSRDRNADDHGHGHAWCRYTSSTGHVMILDPMAGFFGRLELAAKQSRWDYLRPEDKQALQESSDGSTTRPCVHPVRNATK